MTHLNIITISHQMSKADFDLLHFTVKTDRYTKDVKAWLQLLRNDSIAQAKAMVDIAVLDLEKAVLDGTIPASVLTVGTSASAQRIISDWSEESEIEKISIYRYFLV